MRSSDPCRPGRARSSLSQHRAARPVPARPVPERPVPIRHTPSRPVPARHVSASPVPTQPSLPQPGPLRPVSAWFYLYPLVRLLFSCPAVESLLLPPPPPHLSHLLHRLTFLSNLFCNLAAAQPFLLTGHSGAFVQNSSDDIFQSFSLALFSLTPTLSPAVN